jgi:hypothetical protein
MKGSASLGHLSRMMKPWENTRFDRQRESQSVRINPDLPRQRASRFHKVCERNAGWDHQHWTNSRASSPSREVISRMLQRLSSAPPRALIGGPPLFHNHPRLTDPARSLERPAGGDRDQRSRPQILLFGLSCRNAPCDSAYPSSPNSRRSASAWPCTSPIM